MYSDTILIVIVILVIVIILFLCLRELNCWYWKINQRIGSQDLQIKLQKETNQLLEKLVKEAESFKDISTSNFIEMPQDPRILSEAETNQITRKSIELKENEVIVINISSRIIKKMHKSDFSEGTNWIIVKEYGK